METGYAFGKKKTWAQQNRTLVIVVSVLVAVLLMSGIAVGVGVTLSRQSASPSPSTNIDYEVGVYNTTIIRGQEYRLLPERDSPLAAAFMSSSTRSGQAAPPPAASAYYQWHQDLQFLSTGVLDDLLTRLAQADVVLDALRKSNITMAQVFEFKSKLLMYWQQQAPELITLFRQLATSGRVSLVDLTNLKASIMTAFDLEQMQHTLSPFPLEHITHGDDDSSINGTSNTYVHLNSTAVKEIVSKLGVSLPGLTNQLQELHDSLLNGTTSSSSGSNSSNIGGRRLLQQSASLTIPLVFHLPSHKIDDTVRPFVGPYNVFSASKTHSITRLVAVMNYEFKRMKIPMQFTTAEVRDDPKVHDYLFLGSADEYQSCADFKSNPTCFAALRKNNADATRYINVWIFGYQRQPSGVATKCNCPLGQATLPNGREDTSHYLWLAYDLFDPDNMNNDQRYNAGGNVFIHEMGHYLGLQHTHNDDADTCTDGDGVDDTPPNLSAQKTTWKNDITIEVCIPYRKSPVKFKSAKEGFDAALAFNPDSCPDQPGYDNFFNFMSYVDPECMFFFTAGQIQRMWAETSANRPKLYANSMAKS